MILSQLLLHLPVARPEWRWVFFVLPKAARAFEVGSSGSNTAIEIVDGVSSDLGRVCWLGWRLQRRLSILRASAVLGFANLVPLWTETPRVMYLQQMGVFSGETSRRRDPMLKLRSWYFGRLVAISARRSAALIVQTHQMEREVVRMVPNSDRTIRVMPPGANPASDSDVVRRKVCEVVENARGPLVCYVSHSGIHKNHIGLIRAIPILRREFPTVCVVFTVPNEGRMSEDSRLLVSEMVAGGRRLEVQSHISYLGELNRWR